LKPYKGFDNSSFVYIMEHMELLFIPPLLALGFTLFYWVFFVRERPETIPVLLEPPKGLSILECGVLVDDAINSKEIALELYNLYLKGVVVKNGEDEYALNPNLDEKAALNLTVGQALLLSSIFNNSGLFHSSKNSFGVGELPDVAVDFLHKNYLQNLSKKINSIKLSIYDSLVDEGYYKTSPFEQRKSFIAFGSMIFAAPLLFNIFSILNSDYEYMLPWNLAIGVSIAGLILAYSSLFFVRKTKQGRKAKANFLGFKQYVVTAEMDRIKFMLENEIEAYRSILPYAAMFDSLEKWILPLRKFDETLRPVEFKDLDTVISSLDVDVSITEKSRWLRALYDLFVYGSKIISRNK
jgi:Predicted membrane protein (DUF2207) C-terminal domain